jgi:hypothetical protein
MDKSSLVTETNSDMHIWTTSIPIRESPTRTSSSLSASAYDGSSDASFAASPDIHTAAHEAAHVVQQRASGTRRASTSSSSAIVGATSLYSTGSSILVEFPTVTPAPQMACTEWSGSISLSDLNTVYSKRLFYKANSSSGPVHIGCVCSCRVFDGTAPTVPLVFVGTFYGELHVIEPSSNTVVGTLTFDDGSVPVGVVAVPAGNNTYCLQTSRVASDGTGKTNYYTIHVVTNQGPGNVQYQIATSPLVSNRPLTTCQFYVMGVPSVGALYLIDSSGITYATTNMPRSSSMIQSFPSGGRAVLVREYAIWTDGTIFVVYSVVDGTEVCRYDSIVYGERQMSVQSMTTIGDELFAVACADGTCAVFELVTSGSLSISGVTPSSIDASARLEINEQNLLVSAPEDAVTETQLQSNGEHVLVTQYTEHTVMRHSISVIPDASGPLKTYNDLAPELDIGACFSYCDFIRSTNGGLVWFVCPSTLKWTGHGDWLLSSSVRSSNVASVDSASGLLQWCVRDFSLATSDIRDDSSSIRGSGFMCGSTSHFLVVSNEVSVSVPRCEFSESVLRVGWEPPVRSVSLTLGSAADGMVLARVSGGDFIVCDAACVSFDESEFFVLGQRFVDPRGIDKSQIKRSLAVYRCSDLGLVRTIDLTGEPDEDCDGRADRVTMRCDSAGMIWIVRPSRDSSGCSVHRMTLRTNFAVLLGGVSNGDDIIDSCPVPDYVLRDACVDSMGNLIVATCPNIGSSGQDGVDVIFKFSGSSSRCELISKISVPPSSIVSKTYQPGRPVYGNLTCVATIFGDVYIAGVDGTMRKFVPGGYDCPEFAISALSSVLPSTERRPEGSRLLSVETQHSVIPLDSCYDPRNMTYGVVFLAGSSMMLEVHSMLGAVSTYKISGLPSGYTRNSLAVKMHPGLSSTTYVLVCCTGADVTTTTDQASGVTTTDASYTLDVFVVTLGKPGSATVSSGSTFLAARTCHFGADSYAAGHCVRSSFNFRSGMLAFGEYFYDAGLSTESLVIPMAQLTYDAVKKTYALAALEESKLPVVDRVAMTTYIGQPGTLTSVAAKHTFVDVCFDQSSGELYVVAFVVGIALSGPGACYVSAQACKFDLDLPSGNTYPVNDFVGLLCIDEYGSDIPDEWPMYLFGGAVSISNDAQSDGSLYVTCPHPTSSVELRHQYIGTVTIVKLESSLDRIIWTCGTDDDCDMVVRAVVPGASIISSALTLEVIRPILVVHGGNVVSVSSSLLVCPDAGSSVRVRESPTHIRLSRKSGSVVYSDRVVCSPRAFVMYEDYSCELLTSGATNATVEPFAAHVGQCASVKLALCCA